MIDESAGSASRKFAVEVSALLNEVVAKSVIPIAKEIGIVRNASNLLELADEVTSDFCTRFKDVPKLLAADLLIDVVRDATRCIQCVFEGDEAVFDSLDELLDTFFRRAEEFFGYAKALVAVKAQDQLVSNLGGQARKALGDANRQKVRDLAMAIQEKWSKEKAAAEIADVVSLSAGTVRRYLHAQFPGAAWERRHDESA